MFLAAGFLLVASLFATPARSCCPAPPFNPACRGVVPVVNANQTVIMIWDAATKTQHFIRQASFKSDADDFGFLVPTPTQPELQESENEAFETLARLTAPEVQREWRIPVPFGCGGCASSPGASLGMRPAVRVLEEKQVAGFNAVVLEADSADALRGWLAKHGYAYSPEVVAWAKPYVEGGWKFTALKIAKGQDDKAEKDVAAKALRISFKTDRPLFPYREPDPTKSAAALGVKGRLLRIYFIAEARYQGKLANGAAWSGEVAWSGKLTNADREEILRGLKLPETTGPAQWWLTEFEDNWAYKSAPADVYFSRSSHQSTTRRPPIIVRASPPWPRDVMCYAVAAALVFPPVVRRLRKWKKG
jgi:hypothetical protein